MLADDELYRAVELGWQVMFTRFAIWDLGSGGMPCNNEPFLPILDYLLDLREVRIILRSFMDLRFLILDYSEIS